MFSEWQQRVVCIGKQEFKEMQLDAGAKYQVSIVHAAYLEHGMMEGSRVNLLVDLDETNGAITHDAS